MHHSKSTKSDVSRRDKGKSRKGEVVKGREGSKKGKEGSKEERTRRKRKKDGIVYIVSSK